MKQKACKCESIKVYQLHIDEHAAGTKIWYCWKDMGLVPNYCPLCGVAYEEVQDGNDNLG